MNLIKSKQRVADHGEVFTPPWLVRAMRTRQGDPLVFAEWASLGKGKFQRRNFRLDTLTHAAAFRAEDSLFSQLGKDEIFQAIRDYPPATMAELAALAALTGD